MKARVTTSITLEIDVDLDIEWDRKTLQATILGANISKDNLITPRMVYAAMASGKFNELDKSARGRCIENFRLLVQTAERDGLPSPEPDEEHRGVPMAPQAWARELSVLFGPNNNAVPVQLILSSVDQFGSSILIEPVYCKVPTVYIWNRSRDESVFETIERSAPGMKMPNVKRMEDGSLCLRSM